MDTVDEDGQFIYRTIFNCDVLVSVDATPQPTLHAKVENVDVDTKNK